MEEENNAITPEEINEEPLQVVDGAYIEDVPDTLGEIQVENPDDREYEEVETDGEGL